MKLPAFAILSIAPLLLTSCPGPAAAPGSPTEISSPPAKSEPSRDLKGRIILPFHSSIPSAPKITGYRQIATKETAFRDRVIFHPAGIWTIKLGAEAPAPPVLITTASGAKKRLGREWYPEEGGADAAAVFAFVKGDETLVILQGTSDFTYEETRLIYKGDKVIDLHRYAVKGDGMGPDAPGIEPKYQVYPPN